MGMAGHGQADFSASVEDKWIGMNLLPIGGYLDLQSPRRA
jgi:hypothetical protein